MTITRREFESLTTITELLAICSDYGLSSGENIYTYDGMEEYIEENLGEFVRNNMWDDVRDMLCDIPTGYDYYYKRGYFEFEGFDDFDALKDEVKREMDDYELWDEEETEEELEEENDDVFKESESEEAFEEEPFGIDELMTSCSKTMSICEEAKQKITQELEEEFNNFFSKYQSKNA